MSRGEARAEEMAKLVQEFRDTAIAGIRIQVANPDHGLLSQGVFKMDSDCDQVTIKVAFVSDSVFSIRDVVSIMRGRKLLERAPKLASLSATCLGVLLRGASSEDVLLCIKLPDTDRRDDFYASLKVVLWASANAGLPCGRGRQDSRDPFNLPSLVSSGSRQVSSSSRARQVSCGESCADSRIDSHDVLSLLSDGPGPSEGCEVAVFGPDDPLAPDGEDAPPAEDRARARTLCAGALRTLRLAEVAEVDETASRDSGKARARPAVGDAARHPDSAFPELEDPEVMSEGSDRPSPLPEPAPEPAPGRPSTCSGSSVSSFPSSCASGPCDRGTRKNGSMRSIRTSVTSISVKLREALWSKGHRNLAIRGVTSFCQAMLTCTLVAEDIDLPHKILQAIFQLTAAASLFVQWRTANPWMFVLRGCCNLGLVLLLLHSIPCGRTWYWEECDSSAWSNPSRVFRICHIFNALRLFLNGLSLLCQFRYPHRMFRGHGNEQLFYRGCVQLCGVPLGFVYAGLKLSFRGTELARDGVEIAIDALRTPFVAISALSLINQWWVTDQNNTGHPLSDLYERAVKHGAEPRLALATSRLQIDSQRKTRRHHTV